MIFKAKDRNPFKMEPYSIYKMQFQIGKKKLDEIDALIETDCWKAFSWIHSLILVQLKYLFYYKNQVKILGKVDISFKLDKNKTSSKTYPILDMDEHKRKWEKVDNCLKLMGTAIDLCYSRSLIDEEYDGLKKLNSFRNKKIGHLDVREYLPEDKDIKKMCKVGIKLIKSLDIKVDNAVRNQRI